MAGREATTHPRAHCIRARITMPSGSSCSDGARSARAAAEPARARPAQSASVAAVNEVLREAGGRVRIEDVLPLFPDFVTIDAFKAAICASLEDYNSQIERLKGDMADATRIASALRCGARAARPARTRCRLRRLRGAAFRAMEPRRPTAVELAAVWRAERHAAAVDTQALGDADKSNVPRPSAVPRRVQSSVQPWITCATAVAAQRARGRARPRAGATWPRWSSARPRWT